MNIAETTISLQMYKTEKMYQHAVTKIKIKIKLELPFLIRYVSDQYKNEPKCNKLF